MRTELTLLLTREQILGASAFLEEYVDVPEWAGRVRVRGLTGAERDELEASMLEGRGKNQRVNLRNFRAKLVALSIVDAEGKRIFSDADVQALGATSAKALNRVFETAQRLSGLTDEDVEELTEALKNAPSASSTSS